MSVPLLLRPGEGRTVQTGPTKRTTFKITGKETEGHFGLFEHEMAAETSGAAPHVHRETAEMFYVVEGEVEFVLGTDRITAQPGTFLFVPRNSPHGFSNRSPRPATILIMFCPANSREEYFEALAELRRGGRVPARAELIELMERFDQYLL